MQLDAINQLLLLSLDASKARKEYRSLSKKLGNMTQRQVEGSKLGKVFFEEVGKLPMAYSSVVGARARLMSIVFGRRRRRSSCSRTFMAKY